MFHKFLILTSYLSRARKEEKLNANIYINRLIYSSFTRFPLQSTRLYLSAYSLSLEIRGLTNYLLLLDLPLIIFSSTFLLILIYLLV